MAASYSFSSYKIPDAPHTSTYQTPGGPDVMARLSNGTLIQLHVNGSNQDIEFYYSDDDAGTWTKCATTQAVTTQSSITGVSIWVSDDDVIWTAHGDSSHEPYIATYTFSGTDVTVAKAAFAVGRAAHWHYDFHFIAFTDPDNSSNYRILCTANGQDTIQRTWDLTVSKAWGTPSSTSDIQAGSASSYAYGMHLTPKWGANFSTPASATDPVFCWNYVRSTTFYYRYLTYNTGSPGSWSVGTEYTVATSAGPYGSTVLYDKANDVFFGTFKGSTSQAAVRYWDGTANSTLSKTISGLETYDYVVPSLNPDGHLRIYYRDTTGAIVYNEWADVSGGWSTPGWTTAASRNDAHGWSGANSVEPSPTTGIWYTAPRVCRWMLDSDDQYSMNVTYYATDSRYHMKHWDGMWGDPYDLVEPEIRTGYTRHTEIAMTKPLTVNKPSGVEEGDLLVAFFLAADFSSLTNQSFNIDGDASWTLAGEAIGQSAHSSGYRAEQAVFWKMATGSEPSTYSFTWTGSGSSATNGQVVILVLDGSKGKFHPGNPLSVSTPNLFQNVGSTANPFYTARLARGLEIAGAQTHQAADKSPWTVATTTNGGPSWTEFLDDINQAINYRHLGLYTDLAQGVNQESMVSTASAENWGSSIVVQQFATSTAGGTGWGIAL